MPDVNLLKDTERLNEQPKKPAAPPERFELSAPGATESQGFSGVWRSFFNRRAVAQAKPNDVGTMSIGKRTRATERILTETRKAGPSVIPLPEESYNVNLLTDELTGGFSLKQKVTQLGLIAVGAVVVVGLVYGGLSYYQQTVTNQVGSIQKELLSVKSQISGHLAKQEEMTTVSKKIAAIHGLIDNHIRWTRFFERLEHYTLPSVTYGTTFTGDIAGQMIFSAKTDTYEHVAEQYLVLQQAVANHDFIQSFSITGANRSVSNDISTVTFTVSFALEPTLIANPPLPVASVSSPSTPTP